MHPKLVPRLAKHFLTTDEFVRCVLRHLVKSDIDNVESLTQLRETLTAAEYKATHYALNTNRRGVALIEWLRRLSIVGDSTRRALDIGAGYGGIVGAFCAAGVDAVGVEIETTFLEMARKNVDSRAGASIVHGDFLDVTGLGTFDFISCIDVIEHVNNPVHVLARIHEHLNPGGTFLIRVPNFRSIENVIGDIHHRIFGIQLLGRSSAKLSHTFDFPRHPYTIGEFFSHGWYKSGLNRLGFADVRMVRQAPHEQVTVAKLLSPLTALSARVEAFAMEERYDWFLRTELRDKLVKYMAEYCDALHGYMVDGDESFIEKFFDPVWYFVGRRV